ncbi:hypothetical protein CPT75_05605 [Butyrivibrio fibrisolvens]|uniref:Uncharacterized protein n=1 Tax=Butyrivibrio fibrisolvens TaxID=831 RepID=A0A317FY50_BUTFI|nr:hypothetical protein CPT75_05605 [Butyrivibrio fibrisolvens]
MKKKKIIIFVFMSILQIIMILFLAYVCWSGGRYFLSIALLITTIMEQFYIITRIRSSKKSSSKEK